jgi:hypothetical protein
MSVAIDSLQAIRGVLRVGGLPTLEELHDFRDAGRTRVINASGASLRDIYGDVALRGLEISEYFFSDVFSEPVFGAPPPISNAAGEIYLSLSSAEHRDHFMRAVDDVVRAVTAMRSTYLFCRQGVGRAPCVALTSLHAMVGGNMSGCQRIVRALRPQAVLSDVSLSAARWYAANRPTGVAR